MSLLQKKKTCFICTLRKTNVPLEPSKVYLHKLAQRKSLVAELVTMGEEVHAPELPESIQLNS